MKKLIGLFLLCCAAFAYAADAPKLTPKGVELDCGSGGKLTLLYPQLKLADGKSVKPEAALDGAQAVLRYGETGGAPVVTLNLDGGTMTETIAGNGTAGKLQWELHIPTAWGADGGRYAIPANGEMKHFPEKFNTGKAIFVSTGSDSVALQRGETIAIRVKPGLFWQIQDNRAWKWNIYAAVLIRPLPAAGKSVKVSWSFAPNVAALYNAAESIAKPGKVSESTVKQGKVPELTAKGLSIDFGLGGKILLRYPTFKAADGKSFQPTVEQSGNGVVLRYLNLEGAPVIKLALDGGKLTGSVTGNGVKGRLLWEGYLPIMWYKEGAFAMPAGGAEMKFPQEFTKGKTQLGSGYFRSVMFRCGDTVRFDSDPGCYWQLQDNRAWKWNAYALFCFWETPAAGKTVDYRLNIVVDQPKAVKIQVDRFGQSTAMNWPGKITSEADFKNDVSADRKYYGAMTPPERDRFGGLKEVSLGATGFFRLAKWNNRDILVTPEGHPVYHLGVCSAGGPCDDYTYVKGREAIYEWLPAADDDTMKTAWLRGERDSFSFYLANYIRKTGKPFDVEKWRDDVFFRYKKLGFNSQGAFSASLKAGERHNLALTPSLPLSPWRISGPMANLADPFDPVSVRKMDELFAPLAKDAGNPFIVGYFIQCERAYSEVPRKLAGLNDKSAAKREFAKALEAKYGTIGKFNAAWETALADFAAVAREALPVKNKAAWQDVADFSARFYEAYFKLVHDTFRKYDKNHLLIGDRFLPSETSNAELVAACGRYNDIFSVNYYSQSIDPDFLAKLSQKAGRPLMLSEWSFGTGEQGLSGGCINVKDQKERGEAYRNYVEQTAVLPFVIGAQWFAAIDQAVTGRFFQYYNGESMNIGLFNVADRPFKEFHDAVRATNYSIYDVIAGKRPPFAWSAGVGKVRQRRSLLAPHAVDGHKVDGVRTPWPGRPSERLGKAELILGQSSDVRGDFWLCWDAENLYFFIDVNDPTPCLGGKTPESFWNGDGVELFLGVDAPDEDGELRFTDRQLLISATPGAGAYWVKQTKQPPVKVVVLPFAAGNGYSLEAAIPWRALGVAKPVAGMKLRFDIALDNGEGEKRLDQLIWSGSQYNQSNRSQWGTATLVQ